MKNVSKIYVLEFLIGMYVHGEMKTRLYLKIANKSYVTANMHIINAKDY